MDHNVDLTAVLSLDLKRRRIRLHKRTLKKMGDPKYIQFLVNPEEMYLAVLGTDKPMKGGTCNRVYSVMNPGAGTNIEYCSTPLINQLASKIGNLDFRFSYRLTGEVDPNNTVAYFSLSTLRKIERELSEDGKRILPPKY